MNRVLFVAAEGLPYVKSGGLADVIGSLPQSLTSKTMEVSVVLPLYSQVIAHTMNQLELAFVFSMKQAMFDTEVRIFRDTQSIVPTYFIENRAYFERDNLYGYGDDGERFSFFQHAVLTMLLHMEKTFDIIHCHDWHTGMIPVLVKTLYQWHEKIAAVKTVYTIHNLAYQGNFPTAMVESCLGLTMDIVYDNSINFHDGISFMKGGIGYANIITTVSQTYAQEILSETYGESMHWVLELRKNDLVGIVNGIDTQHWNPKTDPAISHNFDGRNLKNKRNNKLTLQKQLGLRQDPEVALISMVSRLATQKGVNLLLERLSDIMDHPVQLVVLGSGDSGYEHRLRDFENQYQTQMAFYRGYNEELAHLIYAGSDLFLMPSLFEPCGISQLISMRYGTLPIVRETGGLVDTVIPYNQFTQEGTGFRFSRFDSWDMMHAIARAVDTYANRPSDFEKLMRQAMKQDVSWNKSAKEYKNVYQQLIGHSIV